MIDENRLNTWRARIATTNHLLLHSSTATIITKILFCGLVESNLFISLFCLCIIHTELFSWQIETEVVG